MDCFEMAKDKVMMGRERRSMIISDEEKKSTAYHEAGHAIVATLIPGHRGRLTTSSASCSAIGNEPRLKLRSA